MAAISALLSAFGFLILHANASLLGVSPSLLHYTIQDYLYVGVSFLAWWMLTIVGNLYIWLLFFVIIFAPYLLSKLKLPKLFQHLCIPWICIVTSILILFLFIYKILPVPEAKNLLFFNGNQQEIQKEIQNRATDEGLNKLESRYVYTHLYIIILSGLILWSINRIHQTWKIKQGRVFGAGRLFLFLLFSVELILLPTNYGNSVYTNYFHKVELDLNCKIQSNSKLKEDLGKSTNVWLLKETPSSFIIYLDGDAKSVHLIPNAQVLSLSITKRQNIFSNFFI